MINEEKRKHIRNGKFIIDNSNYSFPYLNHSFQTSENKLKLKYSFLENIKLSNFKRSIIQKINQIQNNQQKTNIKLSSLINILLSKLIGSQDYKLFHNHFSIIQNKNNQNTKIKKDNFAYAGRIKTEVNHENKTERVNINNNNIKKKIENISLATESEIRRYNLSNQKTKLKDNIFKLTDENQFKANNRNMRHENEEFNNSSNSNLFRINNNNNNYNNSLNKNSSTDNLNNAKKIFYVSNNRKPITFNEITTNINNQNNNQNIYYQNNKDIKKVNSINNNNNNEKIYINASNYYYNQNNKNINNLTNNSINKDKEFNKSNMSENKSNKGPVKIKLNSIEKPILLMNLNENINKSLINKSNNSVSISNNSNPIDKKDNKNNNITNDNKRLSLKLEDSVNNLNYMNENGEKNIDSMRSKRKFSEARSEADSNYSHLSDAKPAMGYSRKIRGFNFRNNIKFNKKPNSSKKIEDNFNKIKGGSIRYMNNNDLFGQVDSLENEYK